MSGDAKGPVGMRRDGVAVRARREDDEPVVVAQLLDVDVGQRRYDLDALG